MSEHKEPIPSMVYNAAVGGHVTNSQQIIDENENKEQSKINAEVKQILGQGGSVDTRIANAINTEKTRAEEVEEQLRQAYEALSKSQPIPVTELPATGEAGKIYRLAGTTSYADYMYNENDLTTPIKMAEYDNAIDYEPTAGSYNLVKSGGVAKFREMDFAIESGLAMFSKTEASMVKYADGTLDADNRYDIYSLKLSETNYTEIAVKTSTIYKIYASIAFYSTDIISADSYMGGVLMEVDVVTPGNEKIGEYSAKIPTGAKLVVISNHNYGNLPIPEVKLMINTKVLNSEIEYNRKQIELKEELVNTQNISNISYPNSFVYSDIGYLAEGTNQNFDIYSIRCKGGERIHAKIGMNNIPTIATVSMFKSPYWDSGRYGVFYLSDKTIANNKNGIIELNIDVPADCHLVLISNNNTTISTPEINIYERYVKDVETTQLTLSPLKNVFNRNTIVFDKKVYISGTTWRIDDEPGAAIAIVPLLGWGSDYIVIDGLGDTVYSKEIIFLDKNKTPNYDGASYFIEAKSSSPKVIPLTRPYWNNNKYIVIQLWKGYADWGNQKADNGYIWSQDEISQGYPNWINNIVINFVNAPNVVPTLSVSDKEYCAGESYDKAKTELFNKVSTELLANNYNPSQKFNFLLATDSHIDFNYSSKRNVEDMIEFANLNNIRQNIDCVIHNGDAATPGYVQDEWGKIDEGYDEYYNIIDNIKVPFIQVSGNHDRHQEHNVSIEHAYTIEKCVSLLKKHSMHSSNTLYDYQDFVNKKIRIIKLDTFDYPLESDGTENNYVKYPLDMYDCLVSQSQMNWFVNTLLSTPNEYNIIVIGHIYAEKEILINPITQILSALINKTSGTASFDYNNIETELPYGSFNVSYDFSSANDVKVVGLFGGHSHKDTYVKSNGINVMINGCQLLEDTTYSNTEIIHRGAYTKYQNNFSAITVDTINNKFKIVRYGYGWPKGIPYDGITEFDY